MKDLSELTWQGSNIRKSNGSDRAKQFTRKEQIFKAPKV
jgi:hypothetical protein